MIVVLSVPAAVAPGNIVVLQGQTLEVHDPVSALTVTVYGTLVMVDAETLEIYSNTVTVGATGRILGYDGARGSTAANGESGSDVYIEADSVAVAAGGAIIAGSGGAGGNDFRVDAVAAAGNGGPGGSLEIIVTAGHTIDGWLVPGRGGDGGHAMVNGSANATAGQGGNGGDYCIGAMGLCMYINDLEMPEIAAPSTSFSTENDTFLGPDSLCNNANGAQGQNSLLANGGKGGMACVRDEGADGAAGANGNPFANCDGRPGGDGTPASTGNARGGRGGHSVLARGGAGGDARSEAVAGDGGRGGNAGTNPLTGSRCGRGGDGGDGARADGGDLFGGNGGNSCVAMFGRKGLPQQGNNAGDGGLGGLGSVNFGGNGQNGADGVLDNGFGQAGNDGTLYPCF